MTPTRTPPTRDLATALRAELDRLPRFGRARFVHADRLEALLHHRDELVDQLLADLARRDGVTEAALRHRYGAGGAQTLPGAASGAPRGLSGGERRNSADSPRSAITVRTIEGRGGPTLSPERRAEQVQKIQDAIERGRP